LDSVLKEPKLKPLHADSSLNAVKLAQFRKLSDEDLINSLKPGQSGSLKARPDGTLIEGHHRIKVLRERGVEVDDLPRDILPKA
jgi:ParB-like chromosome segregation protein Spo0J